MRYLNLIFLAAILACQPAGDHGHSHNEQGSHAHEEEGLPSEIHTVWTDNIELFVEFPPLITGHVSNFAAHFTALKDHRPIGEGDVTVSLVRGSKGIRHHVDAPSSPGIFTPSLQPVDTGIHQLTFEILSPTISEEINVGHVMVYPSKEVALAALVNAEVGGSDISFLKEQAWQVDFQTERVQSGLVYDVIKTSGIWKKSPSDYSALVATNAGVVTYKVRDLTLGTRVRSGQVLATVSSSGLTSNNLDTEISNARAQYELASAEYERKKELHELKVTPTAELEEVRQRYEVAKTNYESLSAGYSDEGKQVTSPIDGYISSIGIGNGGFADLGSVLFTVSTSRTRMLEVQVSPSYVHGLEQVADIWYQPGPDKWSSLNATGGTLKSVGREVSAEQPMLRMYAEVNEPVVLPEGSFTEIQIAIGDEATAPIVPASALLEDYGNYSVIVQVGGESFERRFVEIGRQNGS